LLKLEAERKQARAQKDGEPSGSTEAIIAWPDENGRSATPHGRD